MESPETARPPVSGNHFQPACCQQLAKAYDAAHPRAKR